MLLVLQARSDMLGEGDLCIWKLCPFLIVGECIEADVMSCSLRHACVAHAQYSCIHVTNGVSTYKRLNASVSEVVSWCENVGHHFSSRELLKSLSPL